MGGNILEERAWAAAPPAGTELVVLELNWVGHKPRYWTLDWCCVEIIGPGTEFVLPCWSPCCSASTYSPCFRTKCRTEGLMGKRRASARLAPSDTWQQLIGGFSCWRTRCADIHKLQSFFFYFILFRFSCIVNIF